MNRRERSRAHREPSYRRIVPGTRVLIVVPDPLDDGFTVQEAEVVLARATSTCHRPCPICSVPNPLPEVIDRDGIANLGVEHAADCPVGDENFYPQVVVPFKRRNGRLPNSVMLACEVDADFSLVPIGAEP